MYFGSNDFDDTLKWLVIILITFVPMGIWKWAEILIWLYQHIKVSVE